MEKGFWYHPRCRALKINHLLFADDLMLFCSAREQSIKIIIELFTHFSKASGLVANLDKS